MEVVSERPFFTPFEEILPYAESAAANFLTYLELNRAAFSEEECREICGVLMSIRDLVPHHVQALGESPSVVALLEHFKGLNELSPYRQDTVETVYLGEKKKTVDLSPFDLMRIYSNAAAHPLVALLQQRRGTLSLEECRQFRLIVSNFSILLRDGAVDTEHIQALHQVIFQGGNEHHDAYEILVKQFASAEAKAEHRAAISLAQDTPAQPELKTDPRLHRGFVERLRSLLPWMS